jgi:hypothetical protein
MKAGCGEHAAVNMFPDIPSKPLSITTTVMKDICCVGGLIRAPVTRRMANKTAGRERAEHQYDQATGRSTATVTGQLQENGTKECGNTEKAYL